ncbi:hypothetical protein QUW40_02125 [Collinsella tanakaei]|uniref:hypothetical protein n=1 Tax=Collinsella tanakaei TaxID=626935 RepID=UPI0025A4903D|nr:hypothetical protein [Collinsella tanakaei]MDM8245397.1 hypothetical protein [Collinsella tanakaei]
MADTDMQVPEMLKDENLEQAVGGRGAQELQDYLDSYRTNLEQANQAIKDATEVLKEQAQRP